MKAVLASAAVALACAGHAHGGLADLIFMLGTDDVDAGVVGGVTVLAASLKDCTTTGGGATHAAQRTTATPIAEGSLSPGP